MHWREELQYEVMEDYLRCVEMDAKFTSRDPKAHMEEMRHHWEKLTSFIEKLLAAQNITIKE